MLKNIESLLGAALVLAALLLFLSGMVLRYAAPATGVGWMGEVTIYLVAWGVLMSAAGCVAHREHVRTDFFVRMTGPTTRRWADILAAFAGLVFCAALTWFGYQVVTFSLMLDERGPSVLQIPMAYFYAALPVSMLACAIRYLIELIGHLTGNLPPLEEGA